MVLQQSGLEARSVAAFLHENVLEFVAHDGIDSAADILAYLSDAGTSGAELGLGQTADLSALTSSVILSKALLLLIRRGVCVSSRPPQASSSCTYHRGHALSPAV